MDYLSRPVFEFPVNWANPVNRSIEFDLREVQIGFGQSIFTGRGQYVVNGWSVQLELTTDAEIQSFDNFTLGRLGRLRGFWFPAPMAGMETVSSVSATQFDIADQNLRDTWNDNPDIHLYFERNGVTQAAKITAVSLAGSVERVTVDTSLNPAVDTLTTVSRLHYVRLAEDTESGSFPRENHQQRPVRVIEIPHEYTTAETGERPIYLYHFFATAPIDYHWYYTSFAANVVSESKTHVAAPINHGGLRKGVTFESEEMEITAAYEEDHPLSLFVPIPNGRPINLEIKKCFYSDPDTVETVFNGVVRKVNDRGTSLTAQCDSFLSRLKQRIPAMLIKPECSYQVYEVNTCKAILAKFQTSGWITAINNDAQPPSVEIMFRFPSAKRIATDYFAQGWIETGLQLSYELRTVFNSTWDNFAERLTLTLNAPLRHAVIGQEIQLIPGCDGTAATCKDKFDNFANFPGFVNIPKDNPSFKPNENRASQGDKK